MLSVTWQCHANSSEALHVECHMAMLSEQQRGIACRVPHGNALRTPARHCMSSATYQCLANSSEALHVECHMAMLSEQQRGTACRVPHGNA